MAENTKTTISLSAEFPFDLSILKPLHTDVEIFDRESQSTEHRYSLKMNEEHVLIISEDEKFVFDLMDGSNSIDEIAALFMETKGRIALSMIRNFTVQLWHEGFLLDSNKETVKPQTENKKERFILCPLPGQAFSKLLTPIGLLLLNPVAVAVLLGLGAYACYLLSEVYVHNDKTPSLFIYHGSPLQGLLIMVLTFSIASIVRYKVRLAALGKYKINILNSGLMMGQICPGLFIDAPGINTKKAKTRLFCQLSGVIVIFGIAGLLFTLHNHLAPSTFKNSENFDLLFQVPYYLLLFLIFHSCPILNNDLYLAIANYMNEPYLRKSSFSFVSRHIKKFFAPEEEEQGDTVIYIMFTAGVILWLVASAQFLLSALSQNAQILNGLFSTGRTTGSFVVVSIILLPVAFSLIAALTLIYKFIVKAISSQTVFHNTRNLIIFSSGLVFSFLFAMKLASSGTKLFILLLAGSVAAAILSYHAFDAARKLKGSHQRLQYYLIAALGIVALVNSSLFLLNQNSETSSLIVLISFTTILAAYSSFELKSEWREFLNHRRDSVLIAILTCFTCVGLFMLSQALQAAALINLNQELVPLRSTGLLCLIVGGLSLLINIPGLCYRRSTQSFAPKFVIVFSIHMTLYFYIITGFSLESAAIIEALSACTFLWAIGVGTFKVELTSKHDIQPYPLKTDANEKETLITAFKYIIDNSLSAIEEDFGNSRRENIIIRFNRHAKKLSWDWELETPPTNETVNTLGTVYDQAFKVFEGLILQACGQQYATTLLNDIDDHFHSSAKTIIKTRISNFSLERPLVVNATLTNEKKAEIIKDIILFQDIEKNEMPHLLECLHSSSYETGDLIIKQHDQGDRLFILVNGKAQVEIEDFAGHSKIVTYLSEGEFFGEIALLTAAERSASIRAAESCTVLYLKRKDFDSFLGSTPEKQKNILAILDTLRLLKSIPLFRGMDSSTINLFASSMLHEHFKTGEKIISQGEEGDKFYVILSGNVNVNVTRDDNKEHHVTTLSEGEYFGEIALFKNIPRTANITAPVDTHVISLRKEPFTNAIKSQHALEDNLENVTHRRIVQMMN